MYITTDMFLQLLYHRCIVTGLAVIQQSYGLWEKLSQRLFMHVITLRYHLPEGCNISSGLGD